MYVYDKHFREEKSLKKLNAVAKNELSLIWLFLHPRLSHSKHISIPLPP